jgi:hypothetical protein
VTVTCLARTVPGIRCGPYVAVLPVAVGRAKLSRADGDEVAVDGGPFQSRPGMTVNLASNGGESR